MAVFPETMDRLNTQDVGKSLDRIERYISYMTERVEHTNRKSEKTMEELISKIAALEAKIGALEEKESNEGGA